MLQVSLDGGVTFQDAPEGVIVHRELEHVAGEDESGKLILNMTEEGLITDVWVTRGDADHNIGTSCSLYDDLVTDLIEDDA